MFNPGQNKSFKKMTRYHHTSSHFLIHSLEKVIIININDGCFNETIKKVPLQNLIINNV